jgi:hypothetical protein
MNNQNNEQFEYLCEILDEIMDATDDLIDKLIHDIEIELEYIMREEIEKKYGMPWWQVLNPSDDTEDDYEVEIKEEN